MCVCVFPEKISPVIMSREKRCHRCEQAMEPGSAASVAVISERSALGFCDIIIAMFYTKSYDLVLDQFTRAFPNTECDTLKKFLEFLLFVQVLDHGNY